MSGGHVLALSGGVGGAKLASGLASVLPPERLTVVVNTGDDFEHLDLTICPDIDSVTYALSGLNDEGRGWGVRDETWQAMGMLSRLGEADWFNLGDRDLAMHLARKRRLRVGETLSQITLNLTRQLGIGPAVLPMSDDPVRTQVCTDAGWMEFQRWFVEKQCGPAVSAVRFAGAERARPSAGFTQTLNRADLDAVIICPSNPFLSVDPVLALPGVRDRLAALEVPVVAVSPLVGGRALKGPLAKMMDDLGVPCDNYAIASHYAGLIDRLVIDSADAADAEALRVAGLSVTVAKTVMKDAADRERLAREVLAEAGTELD